jgi:hypothetical protein
MRSIQAGRAILMATSVVAMSAAVAGAQPVSYNTAGSFFGAGSCTVSSSGGQTNNACSQGGIFITYVSASNTVNPGAMGGTANAGFGFFDVDGQPVGASTTFNVPFTLMLQQTNPFAGAGSFNGIPAATFVFDGTISTIRFSNTVVSLAGGFNYSLDASVYNLRESSSPNGGTTTIHEIFVAEFGAGVPVAGPDDVVAGYQVVLPWRRGAVPESISGDGRGLADHAGRHRRGEATGGAVTGSRTGTDPVAAACAQPNPSRTSTSIRAPAPQPPVSSEAEADLE